MYKVDLNSDLGESFGNYKLGLDGDVLKYISCLLYTSPSPRDRG